MTADRVGAILRQLEEAREGLLSYSDEVWLGIDHRDVGKLATGVAFIESLHQRITELGALTDQLEEMVQQYSQAAPRARSRVISTDLPRGDARRAVELDRATPHALDESFTWTRPYGFTLRSLEVTEVTTWRDLYGALCRALAGQNPETFNSLPENDAFLSSHGHRDFTRSQAGLREAMLVDDGIFAEVHYSANSIRDNMKRLLPVFGYDPKEMRVYLRQERDAGDDSVA